ncbi:MAG TPA: beta-N-acetylhexosaminidase [Hyphomicrobiaceae bacterium]|nr:beta-N-acetylhexosaminidase [Hyphomicrobiaceae bacterium]
MRCALITGVAGEVLSRDEVAFLRVARPCGLILFARNCREIDQIRRLVAAAKAAIGSASLLVLIDQEGGRVCRLRPPLWRELPPAAAYGALYAEGAERAILAARLVARLTAADLRRIDVNANCAPVLDLAVPGAHRIIGDRAYGSTPDQVASLGLAVAEGYMAGGVLPIMKHIPGHGRALADSHLELPVVATPWPELSLMDFAPFRALCHMPAAMTAHVVYADVDPDAPASTSVALTNAVIRGEIGFGGLLVSDDLSMNALAGSIRSRAEAVIRAGSDIALHCNGALAEMDEAAASVPALAGAALERFERCLVVCERAEAFDAAEAETMLAEVLAARA